MRLKIAVQKSGRLTDSSLDLLVALRPEVQPRQGSADVLRREHAARRAVRARRRHSGSGAGGCLRPRAGRPERASRRSAWRSRARGIAPLFETVQPLDFGRCQLCIAVPDGFDYRGAALARRASASRPPIRTSWRAFSPSAASRAEVVVLSGSVEIAPRLGRADLICDLVSTGSTLAANHLRQVETVLESQAVLIRTPVPIAAEKQEWTRRLLMRIDGVEQVKGSKYIMLHAPRSALPAIAKLLPGSEAPTVIPLEGLGDRVAVHAVCRENVFWETLEAAEERRRELRAGAAGREDAGLRAPDHAHPRLEIARRRRAPRGAAAARRSAMPRAIANAARAHHRGGAPRRRCGAARR